MEKRDVARRAARLGLTREAYSAATAELRGNPEWTARERRVRRRRAVLAGVAVTLAGVLIAQEAVRRHEPTAPRTAPGAVVAPTTPLSHERETIVVIPPFTRELAEGYGVVLQGSDAFFIGTGPKRPAKEARRDALRNAAKVGRLMKQASTAGAPDAPTAVYATGPDGKSIAPTGGGG